MKILLFTLAVIGISSVVQAQVTSYEIHYYNTGATQPFQVNTLIGYACNQTPLTSTSSSNPTKIQWDDPAVAGKACIYTESPGGPLLSFPVGNYEAGLIAINSFGKSPESVHAPFVVGAVPVAPINLKIVK
jgi:hypothetical protein